MVKKDLMEIQKSFNPEKSTYKVFDELIKHDYTSEEMINVLSKIRGVHKYPDFLKAQFLDVINNLNFIKEQDEREKQRKLKEMELLNQQQKTKELKDIIDNLEKGVEEKKAKEKTEDLSFVPDEVKKEEQVVNNIEDKNNEVNNIENNLDNEQLKEENKPVIDEKENDNTEDTSEKDIADLKEEIDEPVEDDGRLMFIALTLLVIISIVLIGLFVLLY